MLRMIACFRFAAQLTFFPTVFILAGCAITGSNAETTFFLIFLLFIFVTPVAIVAVGVSEIFHQSDLEERSRLEEDFEDSKWFGANQVVAPQKSTTSHSDDLA